MSKLLVLVLVFWAGLGSGSLHAQASTTAAEVRVYGGRPVQGNEAPWLAVIYLSNKGASSGLLCGATVITPKWILTAAHCFFDSGGDRISTMLLGLAKVSLKLNGQKQALEIDDVIVMDGYTLGDWDKDIALVRLRRPIGGEVSPIALASNDDEKDVPSSFRVAGWGKTETVAISNDLLSATIKPVSLSECAKFYPAGLTNRTLCAGDPPKDACHGDSGGPLYVGTGGDAVQFGVVVAGDGCGKKPGVYARVSQHRDWIAETVAKSGDKLIVCTPARELKKTC